MSPKFSGMLGLLLLPLAFVLFLLKASDATKEIAEPIGAAIEAPLMPAARAVVPHQRARGENFAPATSSAPVAVATPFIPPAGSALKKLPPMPELVQDAWQKFEAASRARPDANDVESLPRHLFPVSAAVARIGMAMRNDPNVIAQGVEFFRGCAAADSELFSVRAVCLRNYKFWSARNGAEAELPEVPEEVARIVKALPPAR